jgi:hypothetical protein
MASSTGATSHKDWLTQQRRQQQDIHNYATSSRWYTYLSNAISYIDLAEVAASALDRFRNSWSAIYNLYMMTHQLGEAENITLSRWIGKIEQATEVRRICQEMPTGLLDSLLKAQNTLLKDVERNRWRDSKASIDTWLQKRQRSQALSPEKACNYTFFIGRDIRNAVSHPTINPNAAATRKALDAAADFFLSLAIATVAATIEQPLEGTTGRATAYRSFLYPFLKNSDSFFSDYYLEKVFEAEELAALPEEEAKEGLKQLNRELAARTNTLRSATDLETTRQEWYEPVLFPTLGMNLQPGCRIISEDSVYEPTYVLPQADFSGTLREEYQGQAAKQDLLCLCWTLPWRTPSLDAVSDDPEFAGLTVMEVAQRALLAADVPWAIVTNGQKLRLLSKGTAHKPRCFLEADLAAMIDRRGEAEGKLAYRYLLGLFSGESFTEKDDKDKTRLERVLEGSDRYGQEISDELKQNVFRALEELGEGLLYYLRNDPEEVENYPTTYTVDPAPSENLLADIYQESLSLMYRLLFLFYAESLNLLPMENEVYQETYSLEALRDEIRAIHDDPDPTRFFSQGSTDLWDRLKELFGLVNTGMPGIGIPAYNGGLFDPEQHPFLEYFKVGDYYLARAIDLLSRTRPSPNRPKGEGRKKVTYRDLDIRHLGSIYEGILEYSAHVAAQELVIMLRGTSGKVYEEYVVISELDDKERQQLADWRAAVEEDPEFPRLPKGCKVRGVKEAGSYFLVYGGRESKRKSSGSYYTPDYIVQYIVENTLGSLVRGENREGELKDVPLTPNEILELKVLDPAMGSAHFLVAATEFLAKAYKKAKQLESQNTDDNDKEFTRYKRIIAERCIYGVDLNPMAVELAKLSMWLFTMDSSRPLSFLNHHLKCGNALIGAWIKDLGELPRATRSTSSGRLFVTQQNLFEHHFKARVPTMIGKVFQIVQQETETYQDIETKKILDEAIKKIKQPFKDIANIWQGTLLGYEADNYYSLLTNPQDKVQNLEVEKYNFFHWELEFPEVFFDRDGSRLENGGFHAILGNPPYVRTHNMDNQIKRYLLDNYFTYVGKSDLYNAFIERAGQLTSKNNFISMIAKDGWFYLASSKALRSYTLAHIPPKRLVRFDYQVFDEASPVTAIFLCQKHSTHSTTEVSIIKEKSLLQSLSYSAIELDYFRNLPFLVFDLTLSEIDRGIKYIISSSGVRLGEICEVQFGMKTGDDSKWLSLQPLGANPKPIFTGEEVQRNRILTNKYFVDYQPEKMRRHRSTARPGDQERFEREKILIKDTTGVLACALDENGLYVKDVLIVYSKPNISIDLAALTAILNSKLLRFFYETTYPSLHVQNEEVKAFPLPHELLKGSSRIVEIADYQRRITTSSGHTAANIDMEFSKIEKIVCDLYGLTPKQRDRVLDWQPI